MIDYYDFFEIPIIYDASEIRNYLNRLRDEVEKGTFIKEDKDKFLAHLDDALKTFGSNASKEEYDALLAQLLEKVSLVFTGATREQLRVIQYSPKKLEELKKTEINYYWWGVGLLFFIIIYVLFKANPA